MLRKLNTGNIVRLQSQDFIKDNCWMLYEHSDFPEKFNMERHIGLNGKWLPIVAQSDNDLDGVEIIPELKDKYKK